MTIAQAMIPEYDMEFGITRTVLERVPTDKWDWKIHDKSNTVGWLANHLADIPSWVEMTLCHASLDLNPPGEEPYKVPDLRELSEVIASFDANVALGRQLLESVDDATLMDSWSLLKEGETLMTIPRVACIRTWVLNHTIHHRAIMTVYLRVNDAAVPSIYGPSGDDPLV
ncbi:MAG: DinB family protein [Rubripirellula sp.]